MSNGDAPELRALVHKPRQYHRFTDERQRICLQALEMGYTRTAACAAAGITKQTFYNWIENLKELTLWGDESEPLTFSHLVEQAESRAQGRAETIIVSKIPADPALAWRWLRRHRRGDWGDPEQEERIKEIQGRTQEIHGRIELARMELELARLERELLNLDLEQAKKNRGVEDIDGSQDADQDHAAGSGTGAERSPESSAIEIEYVEHDPAPDQDTETP